MRNMWVESTQFGTHSDPQAPSGSDAHRAADLSTTMQTLAQPDPKRAPHLRWAWAEINLVALRHNVQCFRKLLPEHLELMAILKADAYGHGAEHSAEVALAAGATQLGVATVAEGIELRNHNITAPILVLAEPPATAIPALLEHNLMPAVTSVKFALALGELASAKDMVANYHLAIDSGMTRIGVNFSDVVEFRSALDFHRGLCCAGTFTHFATADRLDDWDYNTQLTRFKTALRELEVAGFNCGLIHANNTAGALLHPESDFDMVRVGIGLFGLFPDPSLREALDINLIPVMSVRSRILRAIYPQVGDGVGYAARYRVPKQNIQIATIPLGYADGLARTLSGEMDVLVDGQRCRQVGNICMDQCMFAVDVNGIRSFNPTHEVREGDVVTVMGCDGDEYISAEEIAAIEGTISYEVTCDFGMRLEKVYLS